MGYPVQCGEFLPDVKEMYTMFPKSTDLEELFVLEDSDVAGAIDSIDLVSPKGRSYRCSFSGKTLDRRSFDKSLAKLAVEAGAELRTKVSFHSIREGVAKTSFGDIRARVIVGADGPNSRTARQAGLENPTKRYPAVTCQAEGDFGQTVRMFFGNVAPGGYAWVIPKRRGANIGAGFNPRLLRERPSDCFRRFLSKVGAVPKDVTMGFVPVSGPVERSVTGNVLLVGDAAGQVMPTNGGGIPLAMMAGRMAGRAIRDHVRKGNPLAEYEVQWKAEMGRPLANSLWTRVLGDLFFPTDRRTEFAMRVLGERGLARAIRCKKVFYVM